MHSPKQIKNMGKKQRGFTEETAFKMAPGSPWSAKLSSMIGQEACWQFQLIVAQLGIPAAKRRTESGWDEVWEEHVDKDPFDEQEFLCRIIESMVDATEVVR
jgi:hypothetical protein